MRIVCVGIGVLIILCGALLWAQTGIPPADSLTRVGAPHQLYRTYAVDTGKIAFYAKQIGRGEIAGDNVESVDSALNRIEYDIENLQLPWGDITSQPALADLTGDVPASRVTFTSDAGGIFGTDTTYVQAALAYIDDRQVADWPGAYPYSRLSGRPTLPSTVAGLSGTFPWSRISSQPSVSSLLGNFPWSRITDKPVYATRWPTFTDITGSLPASRLSGTFPASRVSLVTTGFNDALNSNHTNVQAMAARVNNLPYKAKVLTYAPTASGAYGTPRFYGSETRAYQWGNMIIFNIDVELTIRNSSKSDKTFSITLPSTAVANKLFRPVIQSYQENVELGTSAITGNRVYLVMKAKAFVNRGDYYDAGHSFDVSGYYIQQ